jgi:hypothetical protein
MYLSETRKPLELSKEELQKLVAEFEKITETKFNSAFADQINNFISILREQFLIERSTPSNKQIKRELVRLNKALNNLTDIQGSLSNHALMAVIGASSDGADIFARLSQNALAASQGTIKAMENLGQNKRSKEFSFTGIKLAIATELARELASFGVKITTYRDGIFADCLRAFFTAVNGYASNQQFSIYVAEDLFNIIKKAKEKHTDPERFFLLKFR